MSAYRDQIARFADADAQVLGVSTDDTKTLTKFAESLKLPFPLLADEKGRVAGAYGVKGLLFSDRATFVIDGAGAIRKVLTGRDALDPAGSLAGCPARRTAPSP
jgi:peroxiredoxin Q/BCP